MDEAQLVGVQSTSVKVAKMEDGSTIKQHLSIVEDDAGNDDITISAYKDEHDRKQKKKLGGAKRKHKKTDNTFFGRKFVRDPAQIPTAALTEKKDVAVGI